MFKVLKIFLILFVALGFAMSCGSSSTIEQVCKAGVAKMFEECDLEDSNDVISIIEAFDTIGITLTAQEVATTTESEVNAECVDGLAGETITKEDVILFEAGLEALPSGCDEIMGYLANFGE